MPDTVTHVVDAWIPFRTTIFEDEQCAAIVDAEIGTFLRELPDALSLLFAEISHVRVSVEEPSKDIASYLTRTSSIRTLPLFQCVRVTAQITFNRRSSKNTDANPEMDPLVEFSDAAYYLGRGLELALDLSELSSPGCIWVADGAVVADGKIYAQVGEKAFIGEFHPGESSPNSWPSVTSLPLSSVVEWVVSIGMLRSPLASTRLQRTLAAYTNVVGLSSRREGEVLFHAMQGLEAFYCDGVGDLRRQLTEKSKLWLGPTDEKINIVGQLYDLRSQYVHGAAKLQYWHVIADPWEHDEKSMNRLTNGTSFATRLLVGSIQRCIFEGITDVDWTFSYNIKRRG